MILLENVCKTYVRRGRTVQALHDVSLHLPRGALCAVVGRSGSGKTTLMNILGCLDTPTSGSYRLCGQSVSQLRPDALAQVRLRRCGFIFQQFHLLPHLSALENVELPLRLRPELGARERRERAQAALLSVGLGHRLQHRPQELSGGQQQRVAIARAVVGEPELLLADEPTGNLDRPASLEVLAILRALHDRGHTVILITHDEAIAALCERRLRLENGRLCE